jgi:hypothetical protein
MSFSKNGEQEGKTGFEWELAPVEGERHKERVKEGERGRSIMYSCMEMEKSDLLKLF